MHPLVHFTASQIRVAASCPRIFYFDIEDTRRKKLKQPKVTRIWKDGDGAATACGTLFHNAVEKFNTQAVKTGEVAAILTAADGPAAIQQQLLERIYKSYVNRERLYEADAKQQEGFVAALQQYVGELAQILAFGLSRKMAIPQMVDWMFGDRRRKVDVTFHVGTNGEPVHVTGILDYVFYDWRVESRRIIDYKLTPGNQEVNDLFQVSVYALMHDTQHDSHPDAAVFYLHPERKMISLAWCDIDAQRYKVYNLLASMIEWTKFDEKRTAGLKPSGETAYCPNCPWRRVCVARLGPKEEGQRCEHWNAENIRGRSEPKVERVDSDETEPDLNAPQANVVQVPEPPSAVKKHPAQQTPPAAENDVFPSDALWLGNVERKESRRVAMPTAVLATHTAVVGAAGSGKTWLAKGIVEEAILQGIPVLAIDPQGDLVQFIRPADPAGLPPWERARFDRYWKSVEPRVFTPGSSHATRLCLNPLRLPRIDQLAAIPDPIRRQEEFEGMLNTAAANLASLAQVKGELGAQTSFLVKLLRALGKNGSIDELSMSDIIAGIRAPDNLGIDDPDAYIRKTDRDKLARSLNSLIDGPAGQLFRDGLPLDIDGLRSPAPAGKTPLNVVYLNAMTDDTQKQFFIASLAAEIYRWMISRAEGGGMKLLFYIDEARDYLPAGNKLTPPKLPLIRLFTQGRKYGVGCLLCTQSARAVDYNVFGNCSTKIIGRLEAAQDVDRVGEWFSTAGGVPAWLANRKGAGRGSFVGRWPEMAPEFEGAAFISRPLFSLHEGAWSPDRVERELADNPIRQTFKEKWPG